MRPQVSLCGLSSHLGGCLLIAPLKHSGTKSIPTREDKNGVNPFQNGVYVFFVTFGCVLGYVVGRRGVCQWGGGEGRH